MYLRAKEVHKNYTSSNQRLWKRVQRFPAEVSPEKSNRGGQMAVWTPKTLKLFCMQRTGQPTQY